MDGEIEVQRATFARIPEYNSVILVLWHDKGRTVLCLDDDGAFRPLDTDSSSVLVELLMGLVS